MLSSNSRHTLRILYLLLLISTLWLPTAANAQDDKLSGDYTAVGIDKSGKSYTGTFNISFTGTTYRILAGEMQAVGLLMENMLAVGYGGDQCGVAIYKVAADNALDGQWASLGATEIGTEQATPTANVTGAVEYSIKGTGANGAAYAGTLRVAEKGAIYDLLWNTPTTSKGVGVRQGNTLGATFGGDGCGIALYEVKSDGSLVGQWAITGRDATGTEQATKGINVAANGSGDVNAPADAGNAGNNNGGGDGGNANAPATLAVNNEAVVTEAGHELYLMKAPEVGGTRLTVLLAGDPMLLTGGPLERNGYTWWQVKLVDGRSGYVMQGFDGVDWIAPSTQARQVHPDNPESYYFMGARLTIGSYSKYVVVIRDKPSQAGRALKRIQNRDQMVIIMGGPVIAESKRWWYVRLGGDHGGDAEDSRMGWVAEDSQAYLDPLYSPEATNTVKGGIGVGMNIRLTSTGHELRIRQEPDVTSSAVTTFGMGVDATVLNGPLQAQGFTWWEIQRFDGVTGWIAVAPGWIESYNG